MWWRRSDIDAVDESQIFRSLVVTTRRLFIWVVFFTSSIFSSLTDINMSLIFFVDRLWLLEEVLSREWKLCTMTFLITQRSNIVWTASNWDLLTLLTSIRTQNRIKRFVIDITYRWISLSVNIIFKRNRYSLLLINEIIDKIVSCKHLTRLNIISAFNKLQMHLNSKNYITFITVLKAYKYKMLSFKLTNESIFFQQYMNDILWNFLNDFCQVYLNDILIYSKMRKKHRNHIKLVLSQLCEAELQMNIWKCKFNVEETVFLKVIVSELNLCMNLSKVTVIVSWITSINLKEIQSFMKFINFYHCFIKNFLKLVKSFTQLTRKNTSFVWNKICVQVFDNLKKQVSSISVFHYFDLKQQAILKIDALNYVKDEILSQYNDEKVFYLMTIYSKSMIFAEINYYIYDKKLLVIIQCFKHWWFKLKCTKLFI